MDINITDQEKEELKQRVIQTAEARLSSDLFHSLRNEIVRSVSKQVVSEVQTKLKEAVSAYIGNDERIRVVIEKGLETLNQRTYDKSYIQEQLNHAIMRIVEAHSKEVAEAMKNLIYLHLKNTFYEKKEEKAGG